MDNEASRRGRANREKGIRFERAIATKLRHAGFHVQRRSEVDGFACGSDLDLFAVLRPFTSDHPEVRYRLPVSIQLKSTDTDRDWDLAMLEAHRRPAKCFVAIHRYKRELRIAAEYDTPDGIYWTRLSWEELVKLLWTFSPIKP